jgi:hypothetical protein
VIFALCFMLFPRFPTCRDCNGCAHAVLRLRLRRRLKSVAPPNSAKGAGLICLRKARANTGLTDDDARIADVMGDAGLVILRIGFKVQIMQAG